MREADDDGTPDSPKPGLVQDPKKWKPVFPRDKRERVCAEIMLKQRDGFYLIGT